MILLFEVFVEGCVIVIAERFGYLVWAFTALQQGFGEQHLFLHDIAFDADLHILIKDVLYMRFGKIKVFGEVAYGERFRQVLVDIGKDSFGKWVIAVLHITASK